jgi:hypothetical protein
VLWVVRAPAAGGLVILLLPSGFMPTDEAACCGTQHAMMRGIVTGYAADDGSLDASLGQRWGRHRRYHRSKAKRAE